MMIFHSFRRANLLSRNFFRNFHRQQFFKTLNLFNKKPIQFSLIALAGSVALSFNLPYRAETKAIEGATKVPRIVEDLRDVNKIEKIDLYQYEACPFCNKVRAYLDFHQIPYTVIEVNPLSKSEVRFSSYKKVPLLVVNGECQLVDSSKIITAISNHYNFKDHTEEAKKWTDWVDTFFVHILAPNIYRTMSEAYEAFGYITETGNFSSYLVYPSRVTGASIMYYISKRLKNRHNITDERKSLYEGVNVWLSALANKKFMGGEQPSLADLYMYGVLRSIEGLSTFDDMLANTNIAGWYIRMKAAVGPSGRTNKKVASQQSLTTQKN